MGKFCQFLIELSAHDRSVFSFLDDNFSKWQWIFTKLGVCIDIVEIWFRMLMGNFVILLHNIAFGRILVLSVFFRQNKA